MLPDPSLRPARMLIEEHLALVTSSWTAGVPGALATFTRLPDEPAQRGPNSLVTPQGGLRVELPDDAVAVAYETPSARDPLRWGQTVALCVPEAAARRAARSVVTELGPDRDALRPHDLAGVLFDLGLGVPTVDVLVRTTHSDALAELRAATGQDLVEAGLLATLAVHAPHVVVLTAAGRMELTWPQPGSGIRLAPARARAASGWPAHIPIPDGHTPVLRLHPAHPAQGADGRPAPFDVERHRDFQALLAEFGDPVVAVLAADVAEAVRTLRGPETMTLPDDPVTRAAVAVALRRLAFTDGTSGTLTAWRSRYGPDPAMGDPDE